MLFGIWLNDKIRRNWRKINNFFHPVFVLASSLDKGNRSIGAYITTMRQSLATAIYRLHIQYPMCTAVKVPLPLGMEHTRSPLHFCLTLNHFEVGVGPAKWEFRVTQFIVLPALSFYYIFHCLPSISLCSSTFHFEGHSSLKIRPTLASSSQQPRKPPRSTAINPARNIFSLLSPAFILPRWQVGFSSIRPSHKTCITTKQNIKELSEHFIT